MKTTCSRFRNGCNDLRKWVWKTEAFKLKDASSREEKSHTRMKQKTSAEYRWQETNSAVFHFISWVFFRVTLVPGGRSAVFVAYTFNFFASRLCAKFTRVTSLSTSALDFSSVGRRSDLNGTYWANRLPLGAAVRFPYFIETLGRSFLAASKPIFASGCSSCIIFQDLQKMIKHVHFLQRFTHHFYFCIFPKLSWLFVKSTTKNWHFPY